MYLGVPQFIWMVLAILNLGVSLVKHGEPQTEYNFWHSVIGVGLSFGILLWGGFFK